MGPGDGGSRTPEASVPRPYQETVFCIARSPHLGTQRHFVFALLAVMNSGAVYRKRAEAKTIL